MTTISVDGSGAAAGPDRARRKNAAGDDLLLDFREPEFDLTEPGGVGGCEVEPDAGMLVRGTSYQGGFVRERLSRMM